MTLDDIEARIYELEKARENECPARAGLEKAFLLEFIQHVANSGDGQIQEMASCIFSQYHSRLLVNNNEQEYNICQDMMAQIEADAINGKLEFNQENDRKIFKGTNLRVVYNKSGITITKFH
jgi:hypothetical protein